VQCLGEKARVLHSFNVFAGRTVTRDLEFAGVLVVPGRGHGKDGILELVLDPNGSIGAEDRMNEELLKAAGLCLRNDEEADAKNDAREAHQHGSFARRQEAKSNAKISGRGHRRRSGED
jgi:hypothetical protein